MALYEVIETRRDEILDRWQRRVQQTIAPESVPEIELLDHMPMFLVEIASLLHRDADPSQPVVTSSAAIHGSHRLRLGFSIAAVVREYGALREAIVDTAIAAGHRLALAEADRVTSSIIDGIATAVSEYGNRRDAELQREHNEHLAFLAHELRNPLATALAAEHLIAMPEAAPNPRAMAALGRSLEKMQTLIDHALRVAQAATHIELHRERLSVKHLVEDATLGSALEAERAGVTLDYEVDRDGELFVDTRLVQSALDNIIRNAVKYSHAGGHVGVHAHANGRLVIDVEDSCGGLPEGQVDQMFAPFVRMTTDKSGFGLGLAIAKQAIEAHGGTIRVHNLPGKGCIFRVDLPLA